MNMSFKAIATAVALLLPVGAMAATVELVEGGATNSINLGDDYYYNPDIDAGGAGNDTFTIQAGSVPVSLEGATVTLEKVGQFTDFMVMVNGTVIIPIFDMMSFSAYEFTTTLAAGVPQNIVVSWSGVTGAGAQYDMQLLPAAIPVPAAGLLLITALGGVAAMRRRKTAVAA